MTPPTLVIFAEQGAWKVGTWTDSLVVRDVDVPADASPDDIAAATGAVLAEFSLSHRTVILAIPSHWCLCATVEGGDSARSGRRPALLYQLEEHLPVTAEEIVADFIRTDSGRSLGVASQVRLLQPIVEALEKLGWVVEAICPTAMLAAQRYLASERLGLFELLLFTNADQIEFNHIVDRRLKQWDTLPANADDVAIAASFFALRHPRPLSIACVGMAEPIVNRLRDISELQVTTIELPPAIDAAVEAVQSSAAGNASAWIQLRRDALGPADRLRPARRALKAALAASIGFVVCLCGSLLWRALSYERMADNFEQQQRSLYEHVFKGRGSADGINIASRLSSEERRLRLLTGESSDIPTHASALIMLQQILARAPAESRCQVNELRLNDGKIYLEGVAPSHANGASFVAALSADHMFEMDSPRTVQLNDGTGVAITVTGTVGVPQAAKSQVTP